MSEPRFGRGKAFYFFGSFTSKLLARKKEAQTPGSFIHFKNGRYYVLKPRKMASRSNPVLHPYMKAKLRAILNSGSKYASVAQILLRRNELTDSEMAEVKRIIVAYDKERLRPNPARRKKLVTIYKRVLSIQAQKLGFHRHCDKECKRVHHKYIHDFKPGVKLLGVPDGACLMLKDGRTFRLSNGSMLVSDREY